MTKLPRSYVLKEVHRHNSFQGTVRWAETSMRGISRALTATDETRELAEEIEGKLVLLRKALLIRDDSHARRFK